MKRIICVFFAVLFAREAFAEKLTVTKGATSQCFDVYAVNSSTGAALTGVAYNAASLTCYYHRNTASSATAITLADGTVGTFTSGMWKEIDSTNMPGAYQICPPNAAFAAGANSVTVVCKGASNLQTLPLEIALTAFPTQEDGVVVGSPSPTSTTFALASGQNSNRVGQQVCFTSGTLAGQCQVIASQNATTTTFSSAFSAAPSAGDGYTIGGITSGGTSTATTRRESIG